MLQMGTRSSAAPDVQIKDFSKKLPGEFQSIEFPLSIAALGSTILGLGFSAHRFQERVRPSQVCTPKKNCEHKRVAVNSEVPNPMIQECTYFPQGTSAVVRLALFFLLCGSSISRSLDSDFSRLSWVPRRSVAEPPVLSLPLSLAECFTVSVTVVPS